MSVVKNWGAIWRIMVLNMPLWRQQGTTAHSVRSVARINRERTPCRFKAGGRPTTLQARTRRRSRKRSDRREMPNSIPAITRAVAAATNAPRVTGFFCNVQDGAPAPRRVSVVPHIIVRHTVHHRSQLQEARGVT